MDVRLIDTSARTVPALGVTVEPGQTARDAAGEPFAGFLNPGVLASLLLQGEVWEAADAEATQALADLLVLGGHLNPPAPGDTAPAPGRKPRS
jgi:hypothetical protein